MRKEIIIKEKGKRERQREKDRRKEREREGSSTMYGGSLTDVE